MRWRLFSAFAVLIIVTLAVFGALVSQNILDTLQTFAMRGGFIGADRLVVSLEEHFSVHGSWDGIEVLFSRGYESSDGQANRKGPEMGTGTGSPQASGFIIADQFGIPVFTNSEGVMPDKLTAQEVAGSILLYNEDAIIGYLLPPQNQTYPANILDTTFTTLLEDALIPTILIAGALAFGLSILIAYLLLRPVQTLTSAANKLAQGDLSQRVPVNGKDEISTLARTFNHMAASLEKAETNRRALTADIAHELRTPLAVQRANLEALQDGVYPLTEENLIPLVEQNKLLTQLVEDLRTLAQADSDSLFLEIHPLNPITLFKQIVENFQPQADKLKVGLAFTDPENCSTIQADARRINQVVNNLINNALQHTPEGGQVFLNLACYADEIVLTVSDTGPGIPPEALAQIFDRFFRTDHSRARLIGGSGLGLTIARQLTQAHGGSLTAANHPGGGAEFTLRFPIRERA